MAGDAGLGHNFVRENRVHSYWPKFWVQSTGLGFPQNSQYSSVSYMTNSPIN